MRIISGKHKGKRLTAPKKLPVRPTTDFAKEALFNLLNNHFYLSEISATDLFSGTGNISFELASRGCEEITSVDQHAGCIRFIEKTSNELEMGIQTVKSDVFNYLKRTSRQTDLIFADPPYNFTPEEFAEIARLVLENELLTPEGLLVIEHSKHTDLTSLPGFTEARRYGGSVFSFFEYPQEAEEE